MQTLDNPKTASKVENLDLEPQVTSSEPAIDELPAVPTRRSPKKAIILAVLGVGAIAAGTFGYRWWQYASTHEETENATVAGQIYDISSRIAGTVERIDVNDNQQVHRGDVLVELDSQDAKVKVTQAQAALQSAQLQAQAAKANIAQAEANAQATQTQAQGDISGAIAAIATARATVTEAESGIPAAQAAVTEAQAGATAARAAVQQAQATLEKAQTDYNRYNSLYQQGVIPRQQLDSAKVSYEVALAQKRTAEQQVQQAEARIAQAREGVSRAEAKVTQAREGVTGAQAKLASTQSGLQQARAKAQQTAVNSAQYEAARAAIAQAEASLKDAQLQLSYTKITAPADGRIGRKAVEVGKRIQPGTPLMAIVGNEYWVVANFKETQLENVKPGQEVEIKLDALSHHPFSGRVESLSPASGAEFALLPPDNATGNFTKVVQRVPVKIVFDAESIKGYEAQVVPGMSATVSVEHHVNE
ncbi:HlyD family secretion protein [Oscillatoria sp. FACHB-1406]|uniref:HlyD family secretion protein n=1 Tax=Oscillatoria sp. FACHB-1406 TaxID=2692846 RepID=UPI001688C0E7|nr:HlyD family secretion protein [Oscillatoria sp. FACHB-1406]MBD2580104.1 HlyD family secretion protein [Oscillatoria sp. FACHB-1406]